MSAAIRVKTRVPEDRVVTLTLPPEVPVGDVEFDLTLRPTAEVREYVVVLSEDTRPRVFPTRPTHPEMAIEYDGFQKMLPDLLQEYRDKYVALSGGQVVSVADSEVEALTQSQTIVPGKLVYVRLVTDQPQPIPRFTTRREVRAGD